MKIKEYEIEIEEILQRIVKVKAESEEEAYRIVSEQYKNCEIVLGDEDFIMCEIRPYK